MENNQNIKITVGYIVDKFYYSEEEIIRYLDNLHSFINHIDKLYIYDKSINPNNEVHELIDRINSFAHVEVARVEGFSEAELYHELYQKAISDGSNFGLMMKPGYYFEDESFSELKKYLLEADISSIAVLTAAPLLSCEVHERKAEEYRNIMGCRLIGALVNLDIYKTTSGIDTSYYQTTFDYDYCLTVSNMGYVIMLAQNQALRNQNYRVITRKIGFITLSMYDRDVFDVYYETRNRLYLWDKFKKSNPAYVKLDKKLFKQEKNEMRFKDKHYHDKKEMIDKAYDDYHHNIRGEYR